MQAYSKDLKQLHSQLKSSAKKRNIDFDLSMSDMFDMSFPMTCPILNMPLSFNSGKVQDNSYSVDRIDSSKGYTAENITVISYRANRLKSDASLLELKQLFEYYSG